MSVEVTCRCGHLADAHEHHRHGSECATCPCARWRRALRRRARGTRPSPPQAPGPHLRLVS